MSQSPEGSAIDFDVLDTGPPVALTGSECLNPPKGPRSISTPGAV